MSATPTPAVVPILVYEDIEAAHDFLVGTFGLTSGGLHRLDDGTVVHGEVRNGDAPIWLHRVTTESEMDSPRRRRALCPRQRGRRPTRQRAH
jgi:hypothetical protein